MTEGSESVTGSSQQVSVSRGTTGRSGTARAVRAQADVVAQQEHHADMVSLRGAVALGLFIWPFFSLLDWIVITWIESAPFADYAIIRFGFIPVGVTCYWRLVKKPAPSPAMVRFIDLCVFGGAAACVAAMCPLYRGFESPYAFGFGVVLGCRSMFMAQHWRQAWWPNFVISSSYAVVLLGSTLFVPAMAEQLGQPTAVASFVQYNLFIFALAVINVFGCHSLWKLRRKVFETRSIGRYKLNKRIGRGGMGEVWIAYHRGLKRDVALKLLRLDPDRPQEAIERFEREVKATTELTHPNTVRVFDYDVTDDGIWYYAMELLRGVNVAELVKQHGPVPAERAVHFVQQAARALAEAHHRGIVHRDIKPENLMVTEIGVERDFIKVVDFGIAKLLGPSDAPELTREGWLGGTPAYVSPEAVKGLPVDARTDVYALGAVLYFALTGRPPLEAPNAEALLMAQVTEKPLPPSVRLGADGSSVPHDLEAVVMKCLEKDPDRRYADAGELASGLAECSVAGRWDPSTSASLVPAPPSEPRAEVATAVTVRETPRSAVRKTVGDSSTGGGGSSERKPLGLSK